MLLKASQTASQMSKEAFYGRMIGAVTGALSRAGGMASKSVARGGSKTLKAIGGVGRRNPTKTLGALMGSGIGISTAKKDIARGSRMMSPQYLQQRRMTGYRPDIGR